MLAIYSIIVNIRSTEDKFIKFCGFLGILLCCYLAFLQIRIAIDEANNKKSQKHDHLILLSKMINVDELHKKEREIVNSDGSLNSWQMVATKDPSSGQVQLNLRLIGIPKKGAFEYVIIYTEIKGAPEFHPMIRATRHDNKDIDWYIAFISIPPYILEKNPKMITISKFTNGYNDINEYKLNDICIDWDLFLPLDLNMPKVYNNRGGTLYGNGDFDKAIADYNIVIQIDPNKAEA